jgi:hypothetical protein
MSEVTPAEVGLPDIISVDDHILEPKDLWQREVPPSRRDRTPTAPLRTRGRSRTSSSCRPG